jgi:hypothetical protein
MIPNEKDIDRINRMNRIKKIFSKLFRIFD